MHDTSLLLLLGWVVFGGVVGLIARAIFPGRQSMGWVGTILLGIGGSLVGGMLANFLFGGGGSLFVMQPTGWVGSILGALATLAVVTLVMERRLAR